MLHTEDHLLYQLMTHTMSAIDIVNEGSYVRQSEGVAERGNIYILYGGSSCVLKSGCSQNAGSNGDPPASSMTVILARPFFMTNHNLYTIL